jgi:tetratricopeptide (TPR) repeat protein
MSRWEVLELELLSLTAVATKSSMTKKGGCMGNKLWAVSFFICLFTVTAAAAQIDVIVEKADGLHDSEQHVEAEAFLLQSLNDVKLHRDKAHLYWRLSRAALNLGDRAEEQGAGKDELIAMFEKGQRYADEAIQHDQKNYLGYYWKSANIGRWGQTKGILDSLFKAGPMKDLLKRAVELEPDHSQSYYVLGQLYDQVPGFPISFGNVDYSVSLGRKAVFLMEAQHSMGIEKEIDYDFYTELAKHLYKRNWISDKRQREQKRKRSQYESAEHPLEKGFYYEGVVELESISDREEAKDLVEGVVTALESLKQRKKGQVGDLQEARELLTSW